ncbi:clasp N terminal-domain-containing protein [Gongronella butleri]|nr:clasp N terminal-domain-containing protein [Gongronella butleri]
MVLKKSLYPKKSIQITSKADMDREMKRIVALFAAHKESEDTWECFDLALKNIKQWTAGDKIYQYQGFIEHIKSLEKPLIASLSSERTRLSTSAHDLLLAMAKALQRKYEPLHDVFLPTLVRLFARTNKVHARHTLTCVKKIIEHSKLPRTIRTMCLHLGNNKNKAVRHAIIECVNVVIQVNANADLRKYIDDLEVAINTTAMDPSPDVRSSIRQCYKLYSQRFPDRASTFAASLSTDTCKYLQIASRHKPAAPIRGMSSSRSTSTTTSSKPGQSASRAGMGSRFNSVSRVKRPVTPVADGASTSASSGALKSSVSSTQKRVLPAIAPSRSSSGPKSTATPPAQPSRLPAKAPSSYLAPTTASSAKITHPSPSLSSPAPTTNLPAKYIGDGTPKKRLDIDFRLKRPVLLHGMPAPRIKKKASSPNAPNKRKQPDTPLNEEDINQKKFKDDNSTPT